jgi:hypothetical protein
MRTKPIEGVLRLIVTDWDHPEVFLEYDGLGGLEQRSILRDVVEELDRQQLLPRFLEAVKGRAAKVVIECQDYVSYGIGGGDAVAPTPWPRTPLVWYEPARDGPNGRTPEHLVLRRNPAPCPALEYPPEARQEERLSLEPPA